MQCHYSNYEIVTIIVPFGSDNDGLTIIWLNWKILICELRGLYPLHNSFRQNW